MISACIQYFHSDNSLSRAILTNLQQVTLATFSVEGQWLTKSMKMDLILGLFAPTRSWRSIGGLLRRKWCVRCPPLPSIPLFHALVRVHCTLPKVNESVSCYAHGISHATMHRKAVQIYALDGNIVGRRGGATRQRCGAGSHSMRKAWLTACAVGWEVRRRSLSRAAAHLPSPPAALQL